MTYYICQRNNQCPKPCNEHCLYTHEFKKSRLFHNDVKPEVVDLIKDKEGDWWEVDWDWDKNLPESLRAVPQEIIHVPYEYIGQIEITRMMFRNKLMSKINGDG